MAAVLFFACSSGSSGPAMTQDSGSSPGQGLAGDPCGSDRDCQGQICLGGFCCNRACITDPQHPECATCDRGGNCQYPTATCVEASCNPSTRVGTHAAQCAQGLCQSPLTEQCSAACNGNACGAGCRYDQDCSDGFRCLVPPDAGTILYGSCVARGAPGGSCDHPDECASGFCLNGVCCQSNCLFDPQHLECVGCDSSGACVYPDTACVQGRCDEAANVLYRPVSCAQGFCPSDAGAVQACGNYTCSPTAGCATTCYSDSDCAPSAACVAEGQNAQSGSCCPILKNGDHLYIDISVGSDTGCCGSDAMHPCQTIDHALNLLANARTSPHGTPIEQVTFELALAQGSADWVRPVGQVNETEFDPAQSFNTPINLAEGVVIHGPGIFIPAFDFGYHYGVAAKLPATVSGDPGNPIYLGIASNGTFPVTSQSNDVALQVWPQAILNLSNVSVWSKIEVEGRLNVGGDGSDAGGLVEVGGPQRPDWGSIHPQVRSSHSGAEAVVVSGSADFNGNCQTYAQLYDNGDPATPALYIHNLADGLQGGSSFQELTALAINACSDVNLKASPRLGELRSLPDAGFSGALGLIVLGASNVVFENGSIDGMTTIGVGYDLSAGASLRISDTKIRGNGCYGIYGEQGTFLGSKLQVAHNYIGAVQALGNSSNNFYPATPESPTAQLWFLPDAGPNLLACNDRAWAFSGSGNPDSVRNFCPSFYALGVPSVDVWNQALSPILAAGALWSQIPVVEWRCDLGLQTCSQLGGSGGLADGGHLTAVIFDAGIVTDSPAGVAPCASL